MTGIDASEMTVGATQALLTSGLEAALARRFEEFESVTDGIDDAEVSERFSRHVRRMLRPISTALPGARGEVGKDLHPGFVGLPDEGDAPAVAAAVAGRADWAS